jgi:tRNA-dihydrouridine synthase
LHEGLILGLVFLNRVEEAAQAADAKLRVVHGLQPADYVRSASLWAQVRKWERACRALELGLVAHPGNVQMARALEEVLQASAAAF